MNTLSRRTFIRAGSGLAAGSVLWSPNPLALTASAADVIRVGIIGTGSRGTYLAKLAQDVPELRIMACCDVIPAHLEQGLKRADKGAKDYADYRKLLDNKEIDAVIVATPQSLHYALAVDALDARKHVYCEKTLTYSPTETTNLAQKVRQSKQVFQVGFQERVNPLHHKIKQLIQDGVAGQITHVAAQYSYHTSQRNKDVDPRWERLLNWRVYREFTGGPLDELSAHQIDIVNFILGTQPVRATGIGGVNFYPNERETFDNVQVTYEYANGIKGTFTCLMTTEYMGYNILFYGTKATIEIWNVDGNRANIYFEYDPSRQPPPPKENVDGISGATRRVWARAEPVPITVEDQPRWDTETSTLSLRHFAHCVQHNQPPISNIETGGTSANAVHMGNAAMQKGTVETWSAGYVF